MKTGSQVTSVYVSIEDDGKEGFTRMKSVIILAPINIFRKLEPATQKGAQTPAESKSAREAGKTADCPRFISPALCDLVESLWILDCAKPVANEVMSSVRTELRQLIENLFLQEYA